MHGNDQDRKGRLATRGLDGRAGLALICAIALTLAPFGQLGGGMARADAPATVRAKRVLIVKTQGAEGISSMVTGRIAGYLDSILPLDQRVEAVAPQTLSPAEPTAPPTSKKPTGKHARTVAKGTIDRAAKSLKAARDLARKKRWEPAIREYSKAITLYAKEIGQIDDFKTYHEAVVERAIAYLEAEYDDNGEEELLRALAMAPQMNLPDDAPATAVNTLSRARARVQPSPARLQVNVEPKGATVQVDGHLAKPGPAYFDGLPRGEHVVRVLAPDYEPEGQIIQIYDEPVQLDFTLEPLPGVTPRPIEAVAAETAPDAATGLEPFAASGDFGASFQMVAKLMARSNQLDAIVMSYVARRGAGYELAVLVWNAEVNRIVEAASAPLSEDLSGLQLAVLDLSDPVVSAIVSFPLDRAVAGKPVIYKAAPATVAPATTTVMREPRDGGELPPAVIRPVGGGAATTGPTGPMTSVTARAETGDDDGTAFYETWWFWTITLGIVAGVTTAAILSSQQGSSSSGFRTTVSW